MAGSTTVAFIAFCAAASSVYLLNDVVDAPRDRSHPEKSRRPVASGAVAPWQALSCPRCSPSPPSVTPLALDAPLLSVTIATYLALSTAYNLGLKHQRVVDLAIVSIGFLLRAVAGGAAADLPLSRWFLIVAAFGSLFVVAGKRYSELVTLGERAAETRPSLRGYSASYLRFVWSIAAAVTITAYCLWAFEVGDRPASCRGGRCRWRRSSSRCCASPSMWTAVAPARRRRSRCATRSWSASA